MNFLTLCLVAALTTPNHPGGLDANGGHVEKKTGRYHTHRVVAPKRTPEPDPYSNVIAPPADAPVRTIINPERISITRTNGVTVTKAGLEYNGSTWEVYCASWLAGVTGETKTDLVGETFKSMIIRHPTNAASLFNTVFYYHNAATNTQCESFSRNIVRTTERNESGSDMAVDYIYQWRLESNISSLLRAPENAKRVEVFTIDQCRLISELLPQSESLRTRYNQRLK